jgi:hypothetical protein
MPKTTQILKVFIIICGISMFAAWGIFYGLGILSKELIHTQLTFWVLLSGECLTAVGLLIGGIALLTKKIWGCYLSIISMGMLLYSVMVGTGNFVPRDNILLTCVFAGLWLSTMTLLFRKLQRVINKNGGFSLQSQID